MTKSKGMSWFALFAFGVNGIVGSGIFILPGRLAADLGLWSVAAIFVCGLVLLPIALVYCRLSESIIQNGGPYRYAKKAFGRKTGYSIGWLSWITSVVSTSTVASAFSVYFEQFLNQPLSQFTYKTIALFWIVFFSVINSLGIQYGSRAMVITTLAKILPALVLVIAAIPSFGKIVNVVPIPFSFSHFGMGVFLALYSYTGFEGVPNIAGEAINPKRSIPQTTLLSLVFALIFYCLLQAAVLTNPNAIGSSRPLADLAVGIWGNVGGNIIASIGLLSILGFIAGGAITSPRLLTPLAEDQLIPKRLSYVHPSTGSPLTALWISTSISGAFCYSNSLNELIELATLAVTLQYFLASICLVKIEWKSKSQRILGGVSAIISSILLFQVPLIAFKGLFWVALMGTAVYYLSIGSSRIDHS